MGAITLPWLMVGHASSNEAGRDVHDPAIAIGLKAQKQEMAVGSGVADSHLQPQPHLHFVADAQAEAEKRDIVQKEEEKPGLSAIVEQKALQVEDGSVPSSVSASVNANANVCIQQSLDSTSGVLTVSLSVPGSHPLPEMNALELHVDVSGGLLLVEGFAWASEQNGSSCRVVLQCQVSPASITAKVSKKKRSIVITASVV
jgi:hypothetical protein